MARWLDFSANNFKRSYVHGFLDISGGSMNIRSDNSLNIYSIADDTTPTFSIKSDKMNIFDPSSGSYKDVSNNKLIFLQNVNEDIQAKLDWLVSNGGGGGGGGGGDGKSLVLDAVTYLEASNNLLYVYKSLIPDISSAYNLGTANNLFNDLYVTKGYIKNDLEVNNGSLDIKNNNSLKIFYNNGNTPTFSIKSDEIKVYEPENNTFYDISNSKLRFLRNVSQDISGKITSIDNRISDLSLASVNTNSASHKIYDENKIYVSGSGDKITVTGHVIPNVANGWNLGSLSRPFDKVYVTQSSLHFVDETDPNYLKESTMTVDNFGIVTIDSNVLGVDRKQLVFSENNIVEIGKFPDGLANQQYTLDVSGKALFRDDLMFHGSKSTFENDVHIKRHLTVDGSLSFLGEFIQKDTVIQVTEQMDLSNDGTGPALIVRQHGTGSGYHIAEFYDDASLSTVFKDGGDVSFNKSIRIGENLTVDGTANITGGTTFNSTVTINANQLNTGDISLNGNLFVSEDVSFNKKLDVGGDASFNSNLSVDGDFNVDSNSVLTGTVGIGTDYAPVKVTINSTDSIKIPVGTSAQRPTASGTEHLGYIRYNTDISSYEGFGAGNTWGSLGGVKDVDQDTYISAENSAGADNDQLKFFTASTEKMMIDTNGNIGIGTTNPTEKLHIANSSIVTAVEDLLTLEQRTSASSTGPALNFRYIWNAANAYVDAARIAGIEHGGYGGQLAFYTKPSGTATGINNGTLTEKMRIDAAGNVGIGTTTPQSKLDVNGSIRGAYNTDTTSYFGRAAIGLSSRGNWATFSHINKNDGQNYSMSVNHNGYLILNHSTGQSMVFSENDQAKMTLTGGNFGIGTTTPQSKLDVNGSIRGAYNTDTTSYFGRAAVGYTGHTDIASLCHIDFNNTISYAFAQSGTGDSIMNSHTGKELFFRLGGADKMKLDAAGNFGINTINPTAKLHVEGTAKIIGRTDISGELYTTQNTFLLSQLHVSDTTTLNAKLTVRADASLNENLNVGKVATIDGSLFVKSDASINGFVRAGYDTDTTSYFGRAAVGYTGHTDWASFAHIDRNNTTDYALMQHTGGSTLINSANGQTTSFRINNVQKMLLTSDGNLGIGTYNPTERLHVYGSLLLQNSSGGGIIKGSDEDHSINFRVGNDGAMDTMSFYEFGDYRFYTGGAKASQTEKLRIKSGGNVGIGSTNPVVKLDVNGDIHAGKGAIYQNIHNQAIFGHKNFVNTSNAGGFYQLPDGVTAMNGYHGTAGSAELNFSLRSHSKFKLKESPHHSGADLFVRTGNNLVTESGAKVGIGSTNPVHQLDVVGTTNVTGDVSFNSGLSVDGNLNVDTNANITGNTVIDGNLTVNTDIMGNDDLYVTNYSYLKDVETTGYVTIAGDTSTQKITVNGDGIFEKDVHIKRHLTVDGSINFLGDFIQRDTIIQVTEQMDLSNDGTGPALIVRQHGDQPIASFYDDQTMSMLIKNGGDVSFNSGIIVEQDAVIQGTVGIGTNVAPVKVTINGTDAIKIPVGTTAQRPTASNSTHQGYIRYNTELSSYEGYGAGNAWGSLGGVKDVDQDTYITAEDSAGIDNDQLKFYTANTQKMIIDSNGDVSFNNNVFINQVLTVEQDLSVNGIIRMSGGGGGATSGALITGTTLERADPVAEGMIRYNTDRNLAELYTSSSIWSGVASYKTEQPPLLESINKSKFSSYVTVSWQKFPEVYKDAFTGQSYPIYLQTFVDISYTQLNGNNNSNGWKTIHIGNGNYNTSGNATTPLTNLTFTAVTGRNYSNSSGYTLSFDNKPSTDNLPVFTQDDLFDLRVYGVNNSGTAPIYIYIYEVGLKRTGTPSGIIVTNFENFSKTQFRMDSSFNLDSEDHSITTDLAITDYDISYTLVDTQSKAIVTNNAVQQRDNYDNKNNIDLFSLKPGAKYAVNLRAKNAINTTNGPENNGFGPYGPMAVATDFTNNGNDFMFIDTSDLNSVSHNGMEVTLNGNASINGHLHGTNSRQNRTLLSANNSNSYISLDGASSFYVNYGKQGKTIDATTGSLVTATFNIKNSAGTTADTIQYTKTAGVNVGSVGVGGNQYQFSSAASYTDKGTITNYSKGFVYSSDFDCTNGNNDNTVFNANFTASTNNYYLNYSIATQTENQNQRIDENGNTSTSRTTNNFYVDNYSSTPTVAFNNDPTITVTSSTKLFGIPSVTQVQTTANYTISNFASFYIPYSSNRHSRVNTISKNGYSFGVNDKTDVYQNNAYTMAYSKTSNVTSNRYDANTVSDFTVTVFYLNNSGTPTVQTHTDNNKDVNDIGHIFRDSANTYSGANLYFFDGSNTISGAITTNNANYETTYSSNIASSLLFFNNRFVTGGYSATYNGQAINPFSNWSTGYALTGPNYSTYTNTGIGGFKWIVINVTNKKSGNNIDLSNFRINNATPNISDFGNSYEAYISHDNKFGALDRVFDSGATLWYNDANNTNIADAKAIFGALNTNGVDAFIDTTTTATVYLIVGLAQNANSYFTFS